MVHKKHHPCLCPFFPQETAAVIAGKEKEPFVFLLPNYFLAGDSSAVISFLLLQFSVVPSRVHFL